MWGDGHQIRSFMHISDCVEGTIRIMNSDHAILAQGQPVNLGSSVPVTLRELAQMTISFSGKDLTISCKKGPEGVRARTSDNRLLREILGWEPAVPLETGLKETYDWIEGVIRREQKSHDHLPNAGQLFDTNAHAQILVPKSYSVSQIVPQEECALDLCGGSHHVDHEK
ncbi:unnamed protein product [Amoebophrya sp. A25]|nr:unnamed protein product [Amoebophrya sp. A25]|eukprot:GSA25T00024763001.1